MLKKRKTEVLSGVKDKSSVGAAHPELGAEAFDRFIQEAAEKEHLVAPCKKGDFEILKFGGTSVGTPQNITQVKTLDCREPCSTAGQREDDVYMLCRY